MSRNDLPSERAQHFGMRARETLQTLLGLRGDKLDRAVTVRDLTESGMFTIPRGYNITPGALPLEPGANLPQPEAYVPDLTPPPTPDGFAVSAAISHILIEHAAPAYLQGHGHLRTRVYGVVVLPGDPLPVFGDAAEVAQFSGTVYGFPSNPATTWHLWIKWETADGVLSPSPAGGVNGVAITTGQDVSTLLESLTGQITADALASSLSAPIASIPGIASSANANAAAISTIQTELAALSGTPDYNNATPYALDDIVKYSGGLYRALGATTGNLPTNTNYWQKIGDYASLGDAVAAHAVQLDDHETRITATTNGLVAESSARTTLAATVTANNIAQTAAVQTEATTRATQTGQLYAQYTVKTDVAGLVSGYGLASEANVNAAPTSSFGVLASRFFVAPPTVAQSAAPTANLYPGYVWRDTSVTPNVTRYYNGSTWVTTPQALPFVVQATPTTVNGVAVPAGVYMASAYIQNGTITNAKIANLAVDNAKIDNVSVDKLTAGSIAVGQYIQSTSYVAGSAGWRINGDGTAEFSGVVVRGTVFATAGLIGGITIASNAVRAGQTAYNTGTGFHLGSDGRLSLGNATGNRLTWDGTNLALTGKLTAGLVEIGNDVVSAGHYGVSLDSANYNDVFLRRSDGVRLFRVNGLGDNSISFDSSSGGLNIDGNITARSFSTIGGRFTADSAGNVIADRVSIRRRDSVATGAGYLGRLFQTSDSYSSDGKSSTTIYSQPAYGEFLLDTGINDPDFSNFSINQMYGAALNFSTSYMWWVSSPPASYAFSVSTNCELYVRSEHYRTGSTSSVVPKNRIFILCRIRIEDFAPGTYIYQVRLDNYNWSLFKL